MKYEEIVREYYRIMYEENRLKSDTIPLTNLEAEKIYRYVNRLIEVAKSSLVIRSYIEKYNLNNSPVAFESVSAHTNLVMAIADLALTNSFYFSEFIPIENDYSYREIMEAIRLHDLPENDIGDIPDNGNFDSQKKTAMEQDYYEKFFKNYKDEDEYTQFITNVKALLVSMEKKDSPAGCLIYLADKIAAIFMTLFYDSVGYPTVMNVNQKDTSERDRREMALCDWREDGFCRASEMWTLDFFRMRKTCQFDHSGFFTAIIVMYTLIVNGKWYSWRERDYN